MCFICDKITMVFPKFVALFQKITVSFVYLFFTKGEINDTCRKSATQFFRMRHQMGSTFRNIAYFFVVFTENTPNALEYFVI